MSRFLITAVTVLVVILGVIDASGVRPSQSIGVRGFLKCNGRPAAGVLVKLYDHDSKCFCLGNRIASLLAKSVSTRTAPTPLRCGAGAVWCTALKNAKLKHCLLT